MAQHIQVAGASGDGRQVVKTAGELQHQQQHQQQQQQQGGNDRSAPKEAKSEPKSGGEQAVQLRRSLGLWNGVSIILGVIVGSGIFVSPKGVLIQTGSIGASLTVWCICGVLAMFGALSFAELGTSVGESGGEYTYIGLAYGPLASFLYLWVVVTVILPCSNAISSLTFANYVLQPLYGGCEPPEQPVRLLALAILITLIYVNCVSVDGSIKLQNSFTLAKVLALALIIAYGLYYILAGRAEHLKSSDAIWAGTKSSLPSLAYALYSGYYTYSGWNSLNCVTEELKNPAKNMPRAIIISITTITLIYILTNAAYFAVLSKDEILNSDAIAVLFGNKVLTFATWLMPLMVASSTMSGLNGSIFAASRILFAGARNGQLFSALNMISIRHLTPIPSLIFLGVLSALYLFTVDIITLINYMTFIEASFAALGVSTVLTLRHKFPHLERPIRVQTWVPCSYLLVSFLFIVLPIWDSPSQALIGLSILFSGIPVYYLTANWDPKPAGYQKVLDQVNEITQKLTMSVIPTPSDR